MNRNQNSVLSSEHPEMSVIVKITGLVKFVNVARRTVTIMEVILVETKKILSTIGTFIIVGAVSTAGAALWTNVLNDKLKLVQAKKAHSKSDKVIVVDFKKARRDMGR